MIATTPTEVNGVTESEEHYVKRSRRTWFFFKVEWWEVVSTKHIGNDIYITTDREIRDVYINGKKV